MPPASADRERWLALGLLLAVLACAYLLLHPWWTAPMLQVNAQLRDSRDRELILRTELQQAPEIQRHLAETTTQLAQRPGFLPESSAELATAGLVKRLETVVLDASPGYRSCAINNRSPLPSANGQERFAQVMVQVRLQCGTPELATVLHALENGTPRLFVDNLNVLGTNYSLQFGGGNATNSGLDVSFDLYGYLRPSSLPPAAASARSVKAGLPGAN